jgi:hypothetical protein
MKNSALLILISSVMFSGSVMAGNPDRAGQAGATELLINPWARSSGWGGANVAGVKGIESFHLNVAGLAFTEKTELVFARTEYLVGTDININNFGLSQNLGKGGVLGLSIASMNLGDIMITTASQPDGGLGTFSPRFMNIGLAYSKKFSENIYGGILFRVISEAISNVKAQGFALDAGVQYVTSKDPKSIKKDDIKFGVSVRNIGADMKYTGPGLSIKGLNPITGIESTTEQRAQAFNLPSLVNIGISYDFRLDKADNMYNHRLTVAAAFTSNTFSKNQITVGVEYAFRKVLMLRTGFNYEEGIFGSVNDYTRQSAFLGYNAGLSLEFPLVSTSTTTFALDYSYKPSNPFGGNHCVGMRINLGQKID